MLIREAAFLAELLDKIRPCVVLDIGSGSRGDREVIQPHISAAFRGHNVVWADMKEADGVVQCDVTKLETLWKLPRADMVTACSLLEHVVDIDTALHNLKTLTWHYIFISVPCLYPHHECPIDNDWRPSPEELSQRVEQAGFIVKASTSTTPEAIAGIKMASVSVAIAANPDSPYFTGAREGE